MQILLAYSNAQNYIVGCRTGPMNFFFPNLMCMMFVRYEEPHVENPWIIGVMVSIYNIAIS